jgi:hypothetical protein
MIARIANFAVIWGITAKLALNFKPNPLFLLQRMGTRDGGMPLAWGGLHRHLRFMIAWQGGVCLAL